MRVAGLAVCRFPLVDGRGSDPPFMAAEIVSNFTPDTIPLLDRHRGECIGYVDGLSIEAGRDLRWTGTVRDDPEILERLRPGHPISIETVVGEEPLPAGVTYRDSLAEPLTVRVPHYRGTVRLGYHMVGIALTDRPAAPGSFVWLTEAV